MHLDDPRPRLGHRPSAISRAKQLALKSLVVLGGIVTLASAFVVSVAFILVGLVVVLGAGAYLWWQTRELRRQLRARMQPPAAGEVFEGEVIEGEVISHESTRR